MKTSIALPTITALLALSAPAVFAQTIFSDNFELGNLNYWTASGTSPLAIVNNQNADPLGGTYSAYANLSLNRMHHNIIGDNGGAEVTGVSSVSAWIYDGSMTREYIQVLGYSGGTGLPNGGTTASGSLGQLLAIGKYSSVTMPGEVYDATKYQARVMAGSSAGWFNLNASSAPSRSTGWHLFTVAREADNTTIDFYVDGLLGRTITGTTLETWDTITMGFGTSSTSNGDAWYDGFNVTVGVIPEPSAMGLCLLGGFVLAAKFITRRNRA